MTIYYIDPSASLNGNGLSENSPFNTYPTINVAGNTYLQKTGSVFNGKITVSAEDVTLSYYGIPTIPLIVSLGINRPKVNGAGNHRCITVDVGAHNCLIEWFECYGADNRTVSYVKGIAVGSTASARADNCTISNCIIRDINSLNSPSDDVNGIGFFGDNMRILNTEIYNISDDGIWGSGNNFEAGNLHIHNVAQSGRIAGDCIQLSNLVGASGNYWIHHCVLDHSSVEMKQCFIDGYATGGALSGLFEYNTCIMGTDNTQVDTTKTLNIQTPGTLVRFNEVSFGWAALWLGEGVTAYANIIKGYKQSGAVILTGTTSTALFNNVFDGARIGKSATQVGININSSTVSCEVKNNVGVNNTWGIICYKAAAVANGIDVANNCFNGGTPFSITGGQPASNITANPVLDSAYIPQTGSPCIGAGYKYWGTNARPNDFYNNPRPDEGIDLGPVQGTSHPFHPTNL